MSWREWLRWRVVNENERPGGSHGSVWRHGRSWLDLGESIVVHSEWVFFGRWNPRCLGLRLSRWDDYGISFHIAFPPISFFLCFGGRFFRRLAPEQGRETEVGIRDWSFFLVPWGREHESHSADPWWVRGVHWDFGDTIFGRPTYTEKNLSTHEIVVNAFDRHTYRGTCTMQLAEWSRPRWFTRRLLRAELEVPEGIPIPGKGENSWDCGEDAIYGMTVVARDEHEAVAKLIEDVSRTRANRAGPKWIPERFDVRRADAIYLVGPSFEEWKSAQERETNLLRELEQLNRWWLEYNRQRAEMNVQAVLTPETKESIARMEAILVELDALRKVRP